MVEVFGGIVEGYQYIITSGRLLVIWYTNTLHVGFVCNNWREQNGVQSLVQTSHVLTNIHFTHHLILK